MKSFHSPAKKIAGKIGLVLLIFSSILTAMLSGCTQNVAEPQATTSEEAEIMYNKITPQDAKKIMDEQSGYIILDVRTQEEYDTGHIPGAVLLPDFEIAEKAETVLQDKNQLILVYCRSGRRSKNASSELAALGYMNIYEFGGINDWPYETTE